MHQKPRPKLYQKIRLTTQITPIARQAALDALVARLLARRRPCDGGGALPSPPCPRGSLALQLLEQLRVRGRRDGESAAVDLAPCGRRVRDIREQEHFASKTRGLANILGGFNASYDQQLARHRVVRRLQRQTRRSGSLLGYSTRLLPHYDPCDPFILSTYDDPPTSQPAGTKVDARRLDPADQICALLAIKEDRVRYLREGPGTVYFTGQRDDHGQLIVKWEVTSCLPRRQLEYEECGGAGQTRMWFVAFEVQRRLLAEHVIWLGLIGEGYGRVLFEELCSCSTSHRKYHWMRPGGSLEEIEAIASECLAIIEEPTIIRFSSFPPGAASIDGVQA
ncbi:hypothetical protein B0H14DRAFT_3483167 [Mycena olivaceomarginata]|nr:hypothetical protein B0H14DRAFT_3483167 [Mycena olivaceomarginata]